MNGLVAADRMPHPGLVRDQVRLPLHPRHAGRSGDRANQVKNWFDFLNTRDVVEGYWSITANGTPLASGTLGPLDLEPRDAREIRIPMPQIRPDPGVEYWLNLRFALKGDTLWAKKGTRSGGSSGSFRQRAGSGAARSGRAASRESIGEPDSLRRS